MTVIRVKGFKIFRDRNGHLRCYHRKTGVPVDLKKAPIGSAGFIAECARITAIADAKAAEKEKPGTLGLLICDYRKSPIFQGLAHRTQADYQKVFDYLRPIADTPLVRFDRPLVVRIRDKAVASKGRRFGNYAKVVLSIIFGWGRERGFIADNPASGIKDIRRPRGAPESNRPWSDQERHAVLEAAPGQMRPALALMMYCGLGPKDALALPRNFAKGGEIATRRAKTGEPVFWPMPAPLADILDNAPHQYGDDTLRQFQGHPVDLERLQFCMGQVAAEARTRRAYRSGPDPIRAAAYSRCHPSRERLRRAHNRRRPRTAHNRNGAALRQGGGSQGQDARRCEKLRCGIGQTAKPGRTKMIRNLSTQRMKSVNPSCEPRMENENGL